VGEHHQRHEVAVRGEITVAAEAAVNGREVQTARVFRVVPRASR
jgi:hypothetical protein